jgi:hypothetical protein
MAAISNNMVQTEAKPYFDFKIKPPSFPHKVHRMLFSASNTPLVSPAAISPFFGVFQEYTMTLWESQSLGECFSVEGDFA